MSDDRLFKKNALRMRYIGRSPGVIVLSATSETPKTSAPCDGSELSRSEYPRLFKAIGTRFGEGDSTTTFNLPSLQSLAPNVNYYIYLGATREELIEAYGEDNWDD